MYQKSTLENGIRVVTDSMPSVRSIAMGIVVDTGPRRQKSHKSGLAHMVEHLLFQGTSSRDALQIARFMDEAGGRIGGFTTRDYTCYSATVLDDYSTFAMDLLGDILLNSIFLPEAIEREKKAILREIDTIQDIPAKRIDGLLKAHTWAGHPLGKPVAGRPETIRAFTREDVIYYFYSHYLPDRLIVAAAGNVNHDDFVAQVRDAFWRMLGEAGPVAPRPLEYHPGVAVVHQPVSQVYFSMGIPAYPYAHPDRYGLHIINKILGDGISSRLFRRIREDQGLVYDISSEYHAYRDGGLLVIEGSTQPQLFQKVLEQTLSVVSSLFAGKDPVEAEELQRAKHQIKGQHFIAAEDTHTRMGRLATQEFYFKRHISTKEIAQHINAIDVQCLARITQQDLAKNFSRMAAAVVGPEISDDYESMVHNALQANLN